LGEGERIGVSDRELRGLAANLREAPRGAAVQLQLRRAARLPHDLDVAPEHALRVARAERFHGGFLRREAAGEVNRGVAAVHAVRDFAFREDPVRKPIAVALDRGGDAGNFRGVETESNDGHASQA
jgi:hypothetical protein